MKFEERLSELEGLVEKLEGSDLPLEEALALFEKGVGLVRELGKQLDDVERRLEMLVRDENGELALRNLAEDVEHDD